MLILKNPLLVTFETIAELGSVHAAARRMNFTQTALTLRLQQLEKELGMTLFLRSRKGMSLTSEGKALLQFCHGEKELEGIFLSRISGKNRQEVHLKIVGPTSFISTRAIQNCKHLYEQFPFLRLHFITDDHSDLINFIRTGSADLALVSPHLVPNEMDSKMLKADRYFLVGSPKLKKKTLNEILEQERIIDFHEADETTFKFFHQHKLKSQFSRIFVNNNEALLELICSGIGYGTLTESVAQPFLNSKKIIKLHSKSLEEPIALTWYPRPTKQDYFEAIIKSFK